MENIVIVGAKRTPIGAMQGKFNSVSASELGATAIRLALYQHAQHFYDLADQRGLVVWAEMPLVNSITATQAFTDNAKHQMTELIRQSYNHPSIAFWSIGNEQRTDNTATNDLLTQLTALVRAEDTSRMSAYAHCCTSDTSGLPAHTDVTGYNEYFGWYTGTAPMHQWYVAWMMAPVAANITIENQKTRDTPNAMVAAPYSATDTITVSPCFFSTPMRAITSPAMIAQIDRSR